MFLRIIIIGLIFFLQFNIYSLNNKNKYDSNFNEKLNKALEHAQTHKSFSVQFNQEFYSILRDKITKSEGILKIQTPNSWSYELQKPRTELYMSNGVDFWKYVPDLKHAQHLNVSQHGNSLELNYMSLLINPENIKKVYKISNWSNADAKMLNESGSLAPVQSDFPPAESADTVSIKLESNLGEKGDKQQKVLYAVINVRTGYLDELRVVQLNGNRVRLLFSNDKEEDFNAKTFSFVPPTGIVVDKN